MSTDDWSRAVPASFRRRVVTLDPGAERPYDPAEWRDAIVVVEQGEVELECRAGQRARFARGDILWFSGLPLCVLRNNTLEPAVLVAVARRAGP